MIFENYRIIILINFVLVFFLVLSITNIVLLNIHYKFKEKRKKARFVLWDSEFLKSLNKKSKMNDVDENIDLFVEWTIFYFTSFKGRIPQKLKEVSLELKIPEKMVVYLQSKSREKRIIALLFFSSSNLPVPQTAKKHLLEMVNTHKGSEFYHAASLLALNWPDDYGVTVISAINSDDSMTMNLKLAIAKKIKVFVEHNYIKLFEQLDHNMESKFFMIEAAGTLKIKSAVPILKDLFKEGSFEVMLRSMKALSDLDCTEMTEEFWNKYEQEKDIMFKTLFFKSFIGLADNSHISRIVKEINNRNWFVRYAAAKKLAKMGDDGLKALLNCKGNDACELALAESGLNKMRPEVK
jgi:hypothetical protein